MSLDAHLELAARSDEELVREAYRLLLRRDPEPEARQRALTRLGDGTLSRAALLAELASSEEFERVRALDDGIAHARWAREAGERPRELRAPAVLDSRGVEVPWALARYRGEPRVLDVGYVHAEPSYLIALTQLGARELVGVDLAAADVPGLRGVVADVRALPFEAAGFDLALSISALEHVGADNTVYGHGGERDEAGMATALAELRRVLAPAGRLLLTVPTAPEPRDHGWYVELPPAAWEALFTEAGFALFESELYRRGDDGWRAAVAPGEADSILCAELRPRRVADRFRRGLARAVPR